MKRANLEGEAAERLVQVLREVPFLGKASFRRDNARGNSRVDFALLVRSPGIDFRLVCEVKSSGQPRVAREVCLTLLDYARSNKRDYPVFIAPYISPAAAAICDQYNVGYVDFAGNCRLAFGQVYIRREAFPNLAVQKRDLRSLYSPKAERVLRVLITAGKRAWRTQELADEAGVSVGQVANVKKLLVDREWIDSKPVGFSLRSLDEAVVPLLREWAANYRFSRSSPTEFYSLESIPQIELGVSRARKNFKAHIAFTGFSGAARLAPAVRYQRVTVYIGGEVDNLAKRLGLKQVSSGANVTLVEPYDEGVFYGTREIAGATVVSPVQIYLDLTQTKGRGEEAASAVLEDVIKPLWR